MAAKGNVRSIVRHLKKNGMLESLGIDEDVAAECIRLAKISPKAFEAFVAKEREAARKECKVRKSNVSADEAKASRAVRSSGRGACRG